MRKKIIAAVLAASFAIGLPISWGVLSSPATSAAPAAAPQPPCNAFWCTPSQ